MSLPIISIAGISCALNPKTLIPVLMKCAFDSEGVGTLWCSPEEVIGWKTRINPGNETSALTKPVCMASSDLRSWPAAPPRITRVPFPFRWIADRLCLVKTRWMKGGVTDEIQRILQLDPVPMADSGSTSNSQEVAGSRAIIDCCHRTKGC